MELIGQDVSEEPEILIPDEVLEIYSLWRPTPLYRAQRLEQAIGTRSRIFYKYEGVSPPGTIYLPVYRTERSGARSVERGPENKP
jgi:tryptophan synthase beta chain